MEDLENITYYLDNKDPNRNLALFHPPIYSDRMKIDKSQVKIGAFLSSIADQIENSAKISIFRFSRVICVCIYVNIYLFDL